MERKHIIMIGAAIGGTLGGYLGVVIDNGNYIGIWSILLSAIGGIAGIYIAYRLTTD